MPILSSVAFATAKAYGFGSPDLFAGAALSLAFDETTTLDSRITFTRATDGTYFDSAGTLQTASSGVARFDHRLENGSWVNKGLLIEEQRTNLQLRSEEFDNAYWTKYEGTLTANDTTAPNGNNDADRFMETAVNDGHHLSASGFGSLSTTTNYSVSIFVKANGRSKIALQLIDNTFTNSILGEYDLANLTASSFTAGTGVAVGVFITDVGNGWRRCTISGRTAQVTNIVYVYLRDDSGNYIYTGDVNKGAFFWGAQLEAGAFPTSYIKTTTASVTRNADVASMTSTNFSSWYNATEGTSFWQGDIIGSSSATKKAFSISDNTSSERFFVAAENSSGVGFVSVVTDGNSEQVNIQTPNPATARTAFQTYKQAFAYKVNDFAASLDGGTVSTDTSGTLPTVDRIYLGSNSAGSSSFLNGHIAKFYYWNTRKANSFLQSITG